MTGSLTPGEKNSGEGKWPMITLAPPMPEIRKKLKEERRGWKGGARALRNVILIDKRNNEKCTRYFAREQKEKKKKSENPRAGVKETPPSFHGQANGCKGRERPKKSKKEKGS